MEIWLVVWMFVMGTILGSAANAVIYRLPSGKSWAKGRSMCSKCRHELSWKDLIPLFSYLALKGKCRYCKKLIGVRYFLVELVMGVGYAAIFSLNVAQTQFSVFNEFLVIKLLSLMGIFWVTVVIAVMDWETRLVSEVLVAVWGGLVIVLQLGSYPVFQWSNLVAGLIVGLSVLGGIWAVTRGKAMGFGDVEIAVVAGFWLGWPKVLPWLWVAFVSGAICGVVLMAFAKAEMKSRIAFGPFLIFGAWVAYVWGEELVKLAGYG